MSNLPDGEYLLTDVNWHKNHQDGAFRPLHGFTTGKLTVRGSNVHLSARFNDQFLSNRLSDLEEDGIPVTLRVSVLASEDTYVISASAPTVDRSGASYMLNVEGELDAMSEGATV